MVRQWLSLAELRKDSSIFAACAESGPSRSPLGERGMQSLAHGKVSGGGISKCMCNSGTGQFGPMSRMGHDVRSETTSRVR